MQYRPEIDGLRAIAVLPVIFYHADFSIFQGGYVGVDVFFVISGYLITSIILSEIFNTTFSIANFYERRARRILPVLLFISSFTVFVAWSLLPPIEFKDFGQSLFAVSIFSSNILFWLESGYFSAASDLKPLIHTWSLGVEEQFYILFPIAALIVCSFNRKLILPIICFLFCVSLFLADFYSSSQDVTLKEASFYLLPTRAWELLLGSLIFFLFRNFENITSKILLNNIMSFMGLMFIFYSIAFFDNNTPFPSFYTLLPTIGASFLIIFATKDTFVGKLLTLQPMILVGLISFSAYLWHQPLFAFSRYYFVGEVGTVRIMLLILLTIILSYLSWRFVEQPFRDKNKVSRSKVITYSIFGSLFLASIGLTIHLNNGYEERFSEEQLELLAFSSYKDREILYRKRACFLNRDQSANEYVDICSNGPIYVWGDSHAAGLSYGIRQMKKASQYTSSMCPPILDIFIPQRPNCNEINNSIFYSIKKNKPSTVFLSAAWSLESYKFSYHDLSHSLSKLANENPSVKFIILGGLPQWFPSLPNTMLRASQLLRDKEDYLMNSRYDYVKNVDKEIEKIVDTLNKENIDFLSLLDLLCKEKNCLSQVQFPKNEPVSFDYAHLTGSGSVKIASLIFSELDQNNN